MIVNVRCPGCDHTEPVEVELNVLTDGAANVIRIDPEITNEADVARRFEEHAKVAH